MGDSEDFENLEWLNQEKKTIASVRSYHGGPMLFLNDQPVWPMVMMSPWGKGEQTSQGQARIRGTAATGIHLYITQQNLDMEQYTNLWNGPDSYDYSDLDRNLQAILRNDPQAHIIVKMYVQAPLWWMRLHPEEQMVYADGYQPEPDVVFCGSEQGNYASFTSNAWLQDAGEMLRQLVLHFEEVPWGKRVIGLNILNGHCQEWHYWGSIFNHLPDCSLPMKKYFAQWLADTYGSDENLRKAWKLETATLAEPPFPSAAQRDMTDGGYLRNPSYEQQIIDYYRCQHDAAFRAIVHFAKIVKESSGGRLLAGAYYGYVMTCPWYPDGISMEVSRVLASPYIDFLASPATYEDYLSRGVGGDGLLRGLPDSCRLRGKLHFSESDEGTYQCPQAYHPSEHMENFSESVANLRKQFGQLLVRRSGNWWFDLDDAYGLFLHKEHAEELTRLRRIADAAKEKDVRPNETVLVYSLESLYYVRRSTYNQDCMESMTYTYLDTLPHLLSRSGIGFDMITEQELLSADCPDYKLYIFPNLFYASAVTRGQIREKLRAGGGCAVWLYAPGYADETGIDPAHCQALTGFPLRVLQTGDPRAEACGCHMVRLTSNFFTRFPNASFKGTIRGIRLPAAQEDYAQRYDTDREEITYGVPGKMVPAFYAEVTGEEADTSAVSCWGIPEEHPAEAQNAGAGLAVRQMDGWTSVYSACLITSTELLRCLAEFAGVHVFQHADDVFLVNAHYFCIPLRDNEGEKTIFLPSAGSVCNLITGEKTQCPEGVFRFTGQRRTTYLFSYTAGD